MKVKIGDIIYDADRQPIMLMLDETDKEKIRNMDQSNFGYCRVPEGTKLEVVRKFMEVKTK